MTRCRTITTCMAILPLAFGCASNAQPAIQPTPVLTTSLDALVADSVASEFISRLLASEARLEEPDSLFAPGAIVVADGEPRTSVPRLAGVGVGGRVQLVTTQVSASGAFVWGVLEYRWLPLFESDAVRIGAATLVVARLRDDSWRIVHLHSSSPTAERPDTPRPAPPDTLDSPGRGGRNP